MKRRWLLLGMLLALCGRPPFALADSALEVDDGRRKTETVSMESEAGLQAAVERYIAAVNARDLDAIKAMSHPADIQLLRKFLKHPAPGYEKETFRSMLLYNDPIPKKRSAYTVEHYLPGFPPPLVGLLVWSVRPTHVVLFSYDRSPTSEVDVEVYFVKEDGKWSLVGGVPDHNAVKNLSGK